MKDIKNIPFYIEDWEIWIICFSLISIQIDHSYLVNYNLITELSIGCISAIIILAIQRFSEVYQLYLYYSKITGRYIRTAMEQDGGDKNTNDNIRKHNIDLKIEITYIKKHSIKINAEYWRGKQEGSGSETHMVEAFVDFLQENRLIGNGTYIYLTKESQGLYTLYRQENKSSLVVLYQHIFPRSKEFKAIENRGWQVWEKVVVDTKKV